MKPIKVIILLLGLVAVMLCAPKFPQTLAFLNMLARFEAPYGCIDHLGKQVIDLRSWRKKGFKAGAFVEGRATLCNLDKQIMINRTGQQVGATYRNISYFSEGLAAARPIDAAVDQVSRHEHPEQTELYLWGFVNENGMLAINAHYREVTPFKEGLAAVVPEGSKLWGYLDRNGRMAIPATFDKAEPFSEGYASVRQNHKWGIIDRQGNFILSPEYQEQIGPFKEGLAAIPYTRFVCNPVDYSKQRFEPIDSTRLETTCVKYINKSGRVVMTVYPSPELSKRYIRLDQQECVSSWDGKNPNHLFGFRPKAGFEFSEGLSVLRRGEKYGYIDHSGKLAIPAKFDYAWPFREGRAVVYADFNGGRYSFIDKNGKLISPFLYCQVQDFSEGAALVRTDRGSNRFFINLDGQPILTNITTGTSGFHNGMAIIDQLGSQNE